MTLFLLSCILVVSHIVETITGFGATVIALSLGAHLLPVRDLVGILVLLAWIQSAWIFARGFRHIHAKLLFTRILPFCALGFPLGIWSFRVLGGQELKFILGAFVVCISTLEWLRLVREDALPRPLTRPAALFFLGGGGFFHGLFASGGPLIVYYAGRELPDKASFRATLSVLWLLLNTVLLFSYVFSGRMEGLEFIALCLLPAVAAGILVGELLHLRINEKAFKKFVQVVLFITGISLFL